MKLDRFTEKAQEAILAAQKLALDADSPVLDAEHILAALLADAEGIPALTLRKLDIDPAQASMELATVLSRLSLLAVDHADRIAEIDINPLFVRPAGQGVVAADALVVLK